MTKWEYKRVEVFWDLGRTIDMGVQKDTGNYPEAFEEAEREWLATLNELGADGWELVSETHVGSSGPAPWSRFRGTFKRSKP